MYEVRYVEDEALPSGRDWVLVRLGRTAVVLFIKESRVCERVLEQASAGYRLLEPPASVDLVPPQQPRPRPSRELVVQA